MSANVKKIDNGIIDLTQILQTKRAISEEKELIKFSEILEDIKASIFNLIKKEKVVIKSDFSAIDGMKTLKSYIYSIFFNLITNSIKYRQPGFAPEIEITSRLSDEGITLTFTDNGLGIDLPKNGEEVFGLYKRFHYHVEGKGMGLYMVKTQVEILGGRIFIESEVGRGTECKIGFDRTVSW